MKRLARVFDYFAYYSMAGVFFTISLLLNALCLLGLLLPGRARLAQWTRATLHSLIRFWVAALRRTRVAFVDTPPNQEGTGSVWVMNHPTLVDGAFLLSFVRNGVCIYKKRIASNPFYGCIARLADFIPNIGGPDMVRLAVAALKRGEDVIIFPEGTRRTRYESDRLKPGFALIAKRAKAPIRVLWSDSPRDFMTREVSPWRATRRPARVRIRLVEVVVPKVGENVEQLKQRVASVLEGCSRRRRAT